MTSRRRRRSALGLGLVALGLLGAGAGLGRRPSRFGRGEAEAVLDIWLGELGFHPQHHHLGREGSLVHVLELGRGRLPLVLLHGLGSSAADFVPLMGMLQDDFRLLALDRPGCGLSDPLAQSGHPRQAWNRSLELVAEELGLGRFQLMGHSLGGLAAGGYAIAHPEQVDRLVLLSPLGLGERLPPLWNLSLLPGAMALASAFNWATRAPGRSQVSLTLSRQRPAPEPPLAARYHHLLAGRPLRGSDLAAVPRLLRPFRFRPESQLLPALGLVSERTLLVWGDRDRDLPLAGVRHAIGDYPGLSLAVVPGASHLLPFERPELTARLLREWLQAGPRESSGIGFGDRHPG